MIANNKTDYALNGIKNLLFDLGGVIMDIDRHRAIAALRGAGMRAPEELLGDFGQKGPFEPLERGTITVDEFHDQLRPYFNRPVTDCEIDAAFMQFLLGIPVSRMRALEQLQGKYNIYMLSNTNPIMWNQYIIPAFKADGHDINHYFDGIVTSFGVKAYKPEAAIYEAAIHNLGINPHETLFIDDSQANLDAAAQLGFNTLHAPVGTEFASLIE